MAAWILGGCGANNGAPAFFQCQPSDPYANVEIPDLITTLSVPRIKYVVCPDDRRRKRLYDQYGDSFNADDNMSVTSATAMPSPSGMVYKNRKGSKGSRSQDPVINVRHCNSRADSSGDGEMEMGPDGIMRRKNGRRSNNWYEGDPHDAYGRESTGVYGRNPSADMYGRDASNIYGRDSVGNYRANGQGGAGDDNYDASIFTSARYDRHGNLLPPPISPIAEDQVSARSSDRIRSLQALLGGSALTDRHGKPPPLSAPYYQSGALHEADNDLEPIAVSTPQMAREAAWVH